MSTTPRQIYILDSAYDVMVAEARRHTGLETGGILVGQHVRLSDVPALLVVAATGPGPNADLQVDSVAPDVVALQAELEAWRRRVEPHAVDYIGQWHTHPFDSHILTLGDLAQAEVILDDPDYVLPYGLLAPLISVTPHEIKLTTLFIPRTTRRPLDVPWQLIHGSAEQQLDAFATQE